MSRYQETKLLKAYDFHTALPGHGVGAECCDCDKPCAGPRGYWRRISVEYDEWECYCRACALEYCRRYEDFDADVYILPMNQS